LCAIVFKPYRFAPKNDFFLTDLNILAHSLPLLPLQLQHPTRLAYTPNHLYTDICCSVCRLMAVNIPVVRTSGRFVLCSSTSAISCVNQLPSVADFRCVLFFADSQFSLILYFYAGRLTLSHSAVEGVRRFDHSERGGRGRNCTLLARTN